MSRSVNWTAPIKDLLYSSYIHTEIFWDVYMNANMFATRARIASRKLRQILSRNINAAWSIYIFWHKGKINVLRFFFFPLLTVHNCLFLLLIRLPQSWLSRLFSFNYAYNNLGEVRRHFFTCKDGHQLCMWQPDFLGR